MTTLSDDEYRALVTKVVGAIGVGVVANRLRVPVPTVRRFFYSLPTVLP